ncbi:hypothetical protein KVR01_004640 [Diaporthe batatas]|uniref:uncharacterized protein n=1 Tax=Diaporthe batatas TaxID=748121 RepID=UPI001D03E469|nr:uncharacterized protein KVR01_004640 [Diaporthe batatas]KAG8166088.1 hypothetical protein KVR01_004640 [Diaporthe batatas]
MTLRPPRCILCSHHSTVSTQPTAPREALMAASATWGQTMGEHRAQIVENCSFFSSRDAQIVIILTREPLGNFKAIALRSEKDGEREALLSSESAETVQKAYELLLVKSADAVQNYITTNGFASLPCPKKIGEVLDDDDDAVSSVSSASEIMDGDPDKDLGDSALSFDAESAYESMTEDEACDGYGRARGTHTSSNTRIHRSPEWVRYPSRSPRRDDPDVSRHEYPHNLPVQNFPIHRRRSSPSQAPTYKTLGPARHVTSGPPMPPAGVAAVQPGTWKVGPGPAVPMRPPGSYANLGHQVYSDVTMGGMRAHPSQMLTVHGPPLPPTGRLVPPPPPGTLPQPGQMKHFISSVNLNGNSHTGSTSASSPPGIMGHHVHHPATTQAPPPSASSHSTTASSTPTTGPIKAPPPPAPTQPPPPAAPAPIDCRLCIKSRMPGTGDVSEQRMVVRTLPTRPHVRAAALRYVEYNPSLFRHLAGASSSSSPSSGPLSFKGGEVATPAPAGADKHLRANVTRVIFGGSESYDLTTYGEDDLSRLCASVVGGRGGAGELPLFEVVVTNIGPAGSFFTLS